MAEQYEIISCDRYGQNRQSHRAAVITGPPHEELNQPGTLTFTHPLNAVGADKLVEWEREIMVWRAGVLFWWGVITDKQLTDMRTYEVTVKGLMEWLNHRVIGRADRNNWLSNGDFSTGTLSPWTASGVTANIVTQWGTQPGSYQLNLYQSGGGDDTFVWQNAYVPPGYYTLAAWFHIRGDSTWVGPAVDGRGLYIEMLSADNTHVEDVQFFAITDETVRGQFIHATTNLLVPPGPSRNVHVRLYAPRCSGSAPTPPRPPGNMIWDKVVLVLEESQSFPWPSDLGDLYNNLTVHAQDPTFHKTDCNIAPGSTSTGAFVDRTYPHADHQMIFDAMAEFPTLGLCDFGIEWDQNTLARRLVCHAPKKGRTINDLKLELGGQLLKSAPAVALDGSKLANSIIVQGDGSGPERDEGWFANTSGVGGNVLEKVIQAAPNTHYDALSLQAAEAVEASRIVLPIPELLVPAELITSGRLSLGDTVTVILGPLGDMWVRIVAWEIDPKTDLARLTCNGPI